jgi:hypothetical protein
MLKKLLPALLICFTLQQVKADEGMWLPIWMHAKQIERMQQMGLKLSWDEIYNHTKPAVKDAIVALDGGSCTAEFVSKKGLLFTNHHCGYDEIQSHSSTEHDYLKNGFWAKSLSEELPNPGKTATILISATDISQTFIAHLKGMKDAENRTTLIDSLKNMILESVADTSKYDADIVSFYADNKFVLFLTQTFRDIRLVGAPPSAIGNFGGETDNWVWPRHTGDFSIFRVYCAPDGQPADYSPDNIPYTPKKILPISLKGYHEGDFTFIMGYPGSTNRFATSAEIANIYNNQNPVVAEVRGLKQQIIRKAMEQSAATRIQYSAKYNQSSNYWKYSIGQNLGIKTNSLIESRIKSENALKETLVKSGNLQWAIEFDAFQKSFDPTQALTRDMAIIEESFFSGPELPTFAFEFLNQFFAAIQGEVPPEDLKIKKQELVDMINRFFKDYDPDIDKEIMQTMLTYAQKNLNNQNLRKNLIPAKFKNNPKKYVDWLYSNTLFNNPEQLTNMLNGILPKSLKKDPILNFLGILMEEGSQIYGVIEKEDSNRKVYMNQYINTQMTLFPNHQWYPDANSTQRLTYGTIASYEPRDGVVYSHITTLQGVIEKENPKESDFNVPQKLKEHYHERNYLPYSHTDTLITCFITNNDITGGNSGSPVINGSGELIGIAFDGNWEAMISDLAYNINTQRTICVDIRYVLFVIDKLGEATNLMDELQINQ